MCEIYQDFIIYNIFLLYINYIIFLGKLKFKTKMKKIRKNRVTSHCRVYNASLCFCIYRVPTIIIIKPIIIIIYKNIYASCQLFQNFPPEGSSVQVCAHCLGRCYGKSYETSLLWLCYAPLLYRSMDLHLCRVLRVVSCLFIDTAKAWHVASGSVPCRGRSINQRTNLGSMSLMISRTITVALSARRPFTS